jgi:hypothetical protein
MWRLSSVSLGGLAICFLVFFLFNFFIDVLGYIVEFTNVLTKYQIYHSPWPPLSFTSHSPIPGIVSTGIIFPFKYICIQYLHHIHPPTTPSPHPPLSHWYHLPQTGPLLSSCSQFCKKEMIFFVCFR